MVAVLAVSFLISLFLQQILGTVTLVPVIFVLACFIISLITDGYIYGISAAILSVFAVNFAFTFPFYMINFIIPENLISAVVMIVISVLTCSLTTKIKRQEQVRIESEKERMRANLLRAVSHDLRTPLTTIYGSSSALLENYESFSESQRIKMLEGIKEDSQWLNRLVENLLSITKLDGGHVRIIKNPTVLDELIDSVLIKFNKRYPNREVVVDIPDDIVIIPMDAILIEQVALNILENAVQHAEGMTTISLRVFTISGKAIFEISDNGCGINKERLKTIFTGYGSAESRPTDGKNNAGIGLSVCATIIKAHGGDITAENLSGGGMVFRFTLGLEEYYEQ